MQIQAAPIPVPAAAPKAASVSPSAAAAIPDDPKLKDACKQFEGQFFALVLQEMQKTVPDDPELGDDAHEQQIFQGMLDDNMAQQMAKRSTGAADLADQMYRQLVQNGAGAGKVPTSAEAALSGAAMAVSEIKSSAESTENEHE
jgi:Rod binding domain-containing protein